MRVEGHNTKKKVHALHTLKEESSRAPFSTLHSKNTITTEKEKRRFEKQKHTSAAKPKVKNGKKKTAQMHTKTQAARQTFHLVPLPSSIVFMLEVQLKLRSYHYAVMESV